MFYMPCTKFILRTTSQEGRIAEFINAFDVPDLTEDEILAIDDAGSKLHKRVYMRAVFGE